MIDKIDMNKLTYEQSYKIFSIINDLLKKGILKIDLDKEEPIFSADKAMEELQKQVQKQQAIIDKAIKYLYTCNPDGDICGILIEENYMSNENALELVHILEDKYCDSNW